MEDTEELITSKVTQLTAINTAKVITVICLIGCAIVFGVHNFRQVIYLCLHISYCTWWLLEQWFYPQRRQLFNEPIGLIGFISALVFVGIFYAMPGYFAFTNPTPLGLITVAIALPLYIFGSLINASADVQKMIAKQVNPGLVKDNIWRFSRNINYFGDILRYLSFSVVAGSIWAYLVPTSIAILYIQRILQKEQQMASKYPEFAEYQRSTSRFIPFIW
jgi:protein-S-isoprenylcysteine O-methyltransferase Ste14